MDEQQVPRGVDLDDFPPHFGEAPRAHVSRHTLALDDARRIRAGSDGARLAVTRVPVTLGTAVEVMAVHHALEPATLGDARDLHAVARGEDGDRDRLPGLLGFARRGDAPQPAR